MSFGVLNYDFHLNHESQFTCKSETPLFHILNIAAVQLGPNLVFYAVRILHVISDFGVLSSFLPPFNRRSRWVRSQSVLRLEQITYWNEE